MYQISIICIFQIRFNHVKMNILTQIWEFFQSYVIKNRCRHCGNIGEFGHAWAVEALCITIAFCHTCQTCKETVKRMNKTTQKSTHKRWLQLLGVQLNTVPISWEFLRKPTCPKFEISTRHQVSINASKTTNFSLFYLWIETHEGLLHEKLIFHWFRSL